MQIDRFGNLIDSDLRPNFFAKHRSIFVNNKDLTPDIPRFSDFSLLCSPASRGPRLGMVPSYFDWSLEFIGYMRF